MFAPWKKNYDQLWQQIKKQRHCWQVLPSQSYGFSSSYAWMWELEYKKSWAPNNWCFQTMVLKKTLESPLDCKEIQLVNLKEDQSWQFIGRTDAEAETPIPWPFNVENWLIGKKKKNPDAGKDWRQEEKGTIEDEMVGWHHWLHGYEFEQAVGVGDGQGSLACCSPWGCKKSDTTEQLNKLIYIYTHTYIHTYICSKENPYLWNAFSFYWHSRTWLLLLASRTLWCLASWKMLPKPCIFQRIKWKQFKPEVPRSVYDSLDVAIS